MNKEEQITPNKSQRKLNAMKIVADLKILKVLSFNGLIRLILPQFSKKIDHLIKNASQIQDTQKFDIKQMIGELIIK